MTSRGLKFHPEAIAEAQAAFRWYAQHSFAAAEAFLREIDVGVDKVEANPLARPEFKSGLHRYLFRRFPFSLVYSINELGEIEILAVAHARRKPGYWKNRE